MTDTTHVATDANIEGEYIPKSFQFERDMDGSNLESREDYLQFEKDANNHYLAQKIEDVLDGKKQFKPLADMIKDFQAVQKERLEVLEDYSNGENWTILHGRKRLEEEKADYRIRHDFAGKASRFFTGYDFGKPVTIGSDENTDNLKPIVDFNNYNNIEALNMELGYDVSRFGRAFELHYRDSEKTDAVVLIDVKEMFTIRSADARKEIIGAVHCPIYNGKMIVTVYTNDKTYTFKQSDSNSIKLVLDGEPKKHDYGMVPVVEWQANRGRFGDWEKGIPLIDAYDSAESDTANYMSDLNDALLVIKGDLNAAGLTATDAEKMKKANMLLLESGITVNGAQTSLDAGYIYKQYDVAGTEAYKTRLLRDFYSVIGLIDVANDSTIGANSGIAIQYKLIDLQQVSAFKKGFYTKSLRRRYRLLENVHNKLNEESIEADNLTFTFHQNLPTDVWAEIKSAVDSGMEISQETFQETASFTDKDKERQRLLNDTVSLTASEEERAFLTGGLNEQETARTPSETV
ncbi:phage portal protein [Streptococcus parauberis]|uniref:phage portal protein n=1 Tax=Streptococcus parauberis TaxID=1348 RepID=UPI00379CC4E9